MANGVQKELISHIRDYDFEAVCGSVGALFPAEYEIPRENTGTLKNQYDVGACVAETIAQIAEYWYSSQLKEPTEMSEGFIYAALRSEDSKGYGMIVSTALDLWTSIGTLPKRYFDVLKEMPEMSEIVAKFPEFYDIASKYKLKGYVSFNYSKQKKEEAIKTALMKYNYGLVAVSDKGFPGGGHCIQLTGWNDNKDTYKFKNSWGEDYGDKGFAEISKSKIDRVYLPLFNDVTLPFKDVNENDWFYKPIKSMYFAGFVNGKSQDTFDPNGFMTRAEVTTLVDRVVKEIDKRNDILNRVLEEKI